MKEFLKSVLEDINLQTCNYRVSALKFGSDTLVQFHLNAYSSTTDLLNAVDRIEYSFGYTHTAEAIRIARKEVFTEDQGDRAGVRDIMVILTDGLANVRTRQTLQVINL